MRKEMITKVVLNHFKNFNGAQTIVLSSPEDEYYCDIIIGRNGSGKSCLVEAIEWCLYNRPPRDMRASNLKDLVNVLSPDGKMAVSVELVNRRSESEAYNFDYLTITRSYNGRVTNAKCSISYKSGRVEVIPPDDIPKYLSAIGLPASRMNGIRIKQSQAQVACQAPLDLLHFIETMCGSVEDKKAIDACNAHIVEISQDIAGRNGQIAQRNEELQALGPSVDAVKKYLFDLWQFYCNQLESANRKLEISISLTAEVNADLQSSKGELAKVTVSLAEFERCASTTTARKAALKSSLQTKLKDIENVKRSVNKSGRDIVVLQQRIVEEEAQLSEKLRSIDDINRKAIRVKKKLAQIAKKVEVSESTRKGAVEYIRLFESCARCFHFTAEFDSICNRYWRMHSQLEGMNCVMAQWEKMQLKWNAYQSDMERVTRCNVDIDADVKEAKRQIVSSTQKKNDLNTQIVDLKQVMYRTQKKLDALIFTCDAMYADKARMEAAQKAAVGSTALEGFISKLRVSKNDVVGMLLGLAVPAEPCYATAVMSVLGRKAASTVVVQTRECALRTAREISAANLYCSTILIVNELRGRFKASAIYSAQNRFIPLIDAVQLTTAVARDVYESILSKWALFLGSGTEMAGLSARYPGLNAVSLDGCQYLADGEINLTANSSTRASSTARSGRQQPWPSGAEPYRKEEYLRLEARICEQICDINTAKENIDGINEQVETLQGEWYRLNSEAEKHHLAVRSLKGQYQKEPVKPVGDKSSVQKKKEMYDRLVKDKRETGDLIAKELDGRTYQGERAADIIFNIMAHRRALIASESNSRILQQEMLSSEQLLKDFTEAQQLTVEELPVLESSLEKDRIMENRLSEQYQMAIEDSCSTYLMTTGVRNALAAASTVVQESTRNIAEVKRKRDATQKRIRCLDTQLEALESAKLESEELRSKSRTAIDAIALYEVDMVTPSAFAEIPHMNIKELDAYLQKLFGQREYLTSKESRLNMKVLQQVSSLRSVLNDLKRDVAAQQQHMQSVHHEALQAAASRYRTVAHALSHINDSLGACYNKLIDCGECYLSYPSDSTSLFAEGVLVTARSGDRPWTEVHKLSGGQQAACGFALLVSFQDVFPSPVYILDEVDAFVDTRTVYRMGQLLKSRSKQKGTQFIAVSHHPELQVAASRIIGLFHVNGEVMSSSVAGFV